jgi:hypothetical protein
VVCLDSGAGNYDQLWLTTSLRGMASGTLKVEILTEGIHSGDASGLVPSSFRIMRQVLDRLEDSATGRLLPASFHCEVPAERLAQARATAAILGEEVYKRFPWAHYDCGGSTTFALPTTTDPLQALLNRTWEPTLSRDRRRGIPRHAGCRERAAPLHRLQAEPAPAAAGGRCGGRAGAEGAAGRQRALPGEGHLRERQRRHRLERARGRAVVRTAAERGQPGPFRRACGYIGQGGTIPLMNMLSEGFPKAQMMVCGVLGPRSNAHGPMSSCTCPTPSKLTAAVAQVLARMP